MFTLNCNGRLLVWEKPLIMGIINSTPDSFFEGSRFSGTDAVLAQAETMLEAHEALCEAAPENIFRFKDVLDFLRQDLHRETPSK